mgnify:FL=1
MGSGPGASSGTTGGAVESTAPGAETNEDGTSAIPDDMSTSGEGDNGVDSSTVSDTDDPPICPHTCVAEAPEGWIGPVSVLDGAANVMLPDCGGAYPELVAEHSTQPVGADATCSCTCGSATGVSCTYQIAGFPNSNCTGTPGPGWTPLLALNGCVNTPTSTNSWWSLQANPSGGSCTPTSNKQVPTPTFDRQIRVCGGDWTAVGCESGEVCVQAPGVPLPPEICIYREGEHDCPTGPYVERSVHQTAYEDTRDCSPACECASPQGECTGTTATLFRDVDTCVQEFCASPPCNVIKSQGCSQISLSQVRSVRRNLNASFSGSCAEEGFAPTGAVLPTEPVTVCCAST